MDYTIEEKAMFMREALKEAEIALANDEIPIGCVLVKDGQIIGRGPVSYTHLDVYKRQMNMVNKSSNM